jgi:hypothetical protein
MTVEEYNLFRQTLYSAGDTFNFYREVPFRTNPEQNIEELQRISGGK